MADPPQYRETEGDTTRGHEPGAAGNTRRWMFVLGIMAIGLVGLMVFLHLTGSLGPSVH